MPQKQNFIILNFSFDKWGSKNIFKQLIFNMLENDISITPVSQVVPGASRSDITVKFEGERMQAMRSHLTVLWFPDFENDGEWEEALRASL